MENAEPPFTLLTPQDYATVPWKNGKGVTHDVMLLPEGSGHDDFDIRISLAPITEEGPFSSFPGIDRRITRLSTERLSLVFGDGREVPLERLVPLAFDSALAPVSRLPDGAARVINVMTRRGVYASELEVVRDGRRTVPGGTGHTVVFCVEGRMEAGGREIAAGQTLHLRDSSPVEIEILGTALIARIVPVRATAK